MNNEITLKNITHETLTQDNEQTMTEGLTTQDEETNWRTGVGNYLIWKHTRWQWKKSTLFLLN